MRCSRRSKKVIDFGFENGAPSRAQNGTGFRAQNGAGFRSKIEPDFETKMDPDPELKMDPDLVPKGFRISATRRSQILSKSEPKIRCPNYI